MVLILLSLLCKYDKLIQKLHQEKLATLLKGDFFISRFKVGSVPEMISEEVIYYINLQNFLKSRLPRKNLKFMLDVCRRKRVGKSSIF